jgi:hypothetical protein
MPSAWNLAFERITSANDLNQSGRLPEPNLLIVAWSWIGVVLKLVNNSSNIERSQSGVQAPVARDVDATKGNSSATSPPLKYVNQYRYVALQSET